jgi:hypothetical protein
VLVAKKSWGTEIRSIKPINGNLPWRRIMKFIHYIEKISGITVYGLSSLFLFGIIFIVMLMWVFKADRKLMDEISQIPLQ